MEGGEGDEGAVGGSFLIDRGRPVAAAAHALGGVGVAVAAIDRGHLARDGAVDGERAGRAVPLAVAERVDGELPALEVDGEHALVHLGGREDLHAAVHRPAVGDPAVVARQPRPAAEADEHLVDVGLAVAARVLARDHGETQGLLIAALGHPVRRPDLGEAAGDRVHQPVGDVGGGDRGADRIAGPADDAAIAQQHPDAPRAALVVRDGVVDVVEDAGAAGGDGAGLAQVQPAVDAVDIVAHIHRDHRRVGIDRHPRPDRNPFVGDARQRIVPVLVGPCAGRQRPDRGGGAALAIGHPGLDERGDGLRPVLLHQLLDPALGGAAGAHLREIVAVPEVGHPHLDLGHADDVADFLVAPLHPHAGEVQPFLEDGLGVGQVGGRDRRADIGVVRARDGPEERLAVEEHRHAEREVRVVRDTRVRAVVEEGVALLDVVEELGERPGREVDRRRVHRDALLDADQPVVVGEDRAGHVARDLDHARLARAQHAVAHLAQDGAEAAGEHREQHRVEVRRCGRHGAAADGDRVRFGVGQVFHGGYSRRPGAGCAGRRRACQIPAAASIGPARPKADRNRDSAG